MCTHNPSSLDTIDTFSYLPRVSFDVVFKLKCIDACHGDGTLYKRIPAATETEAGGGRGVSVR